MLQHLLIQELDCRYLVNYYNYWWCFSLYVYVTSKGCCRAVNQIPGPVIYISIYPSIHLPIYPSIYLSIYLN